MPTPGGWYNRLTLSGIARGFKEPWFLILPPGSDNLLTAKEVVDLAWQMREDIEQLRRKRRHGTRRSLSVLTVALFIATDSFYRLILQMG